MSYCGQVPWLKVHDYLLSLGTCKTSQDFMHVACAELGKLIPFDTAAAIMSTCDARCLDRIGLTDSIAVSYNEYYRTKQPFFLSGDGDHQDFPFLQSTPVVDWREYGELEYVADFMLPNRMCWSLAHVFPAHKLTLSAQRSRTSPGFSETEVAILDVLNKDLNDLYTRLDYDRDAFDPSLSAQEIADRFRSLSKREAEMCALVVRRLSTSEISACLFISHRTVEKHVENIFQKLDVRSRGQLRRKIGAQVLVR